MTNLLRAALLAVCLFNVSLAARADDTGPVDPQPVPADRADHPHLYGSFCSAATTSGLWAFVFNARDVDANCDYIQRVLAASTPTPIFASNRGYYLLQGWNEAVANCGLLRSHFYERGGLALQRAYEYARVIGGQGCTFEVYFQQ